MRCPIHDKPPVFVSGFIQKCCCDEFTEEALTIAEELAVIPEIDGYDDDDDWGDDDEYDDDE